jgi:hypothetical protein
MTVQLVGRSEVADGPGRGRTCGDVKTTKSYDCVTPVVPSGGAARWCNPEAPPGGAADASTVA